MLAEDEIDRVYHGVGGRSLDLLQRVMQCGETRNNQLEGSKTVVLRVKRGPVDAHFGVVDQVLTEGMQHRQHSVLWVLLGACRVTQISCTVAVGHHEAGLIQVVTKVGRSPGAKGLIDANKAEVFILDVPAGAVELVHIGGGGGCLAGRVVGQQRRNRRALRQRSCQVRGTGHKADQGLGNDLSETFIVEEDESMVLHQRAAQTGPELIQAQRQLAARKQLRGR